MDICEQQAIMRIETRSERFWRHQREMRAQLAWPLKIFYWRFIYRHHMRLIHPRRHQWKRVHPMDGPAMDWCQWCGLKRVYVDVPRNVSSNLTVKR